MAGQRLSSDQVEESCARLREVLPQRDSVSMEIVRETKSNLPHGW